MTHRVYCFNAGPAALPLPVLEEVQAELLDYNGTGMSVMELSHRGPDYSGIHSEAQVLFRELLGLNDDWKVLFLSGGSSTQFFALPYNILEKNKTADYIVTGSWSKKAVKEAKQFGAVHIAHDAADADGKYYYIPGQSRLNLNPDAAYLHFTSNNTIAGTQFRTFPQAPPGVFLAADMCSDLLWRKFDPEPFGIFYASAQKNLGPSGVTVVAVRKEFLQRCRDDVPAMVSYRIHADNDSLYNTPPTFAVYIAGKVLKWLESIGGLDEMERRNLEKAGMLYRTIDAEPEFWRTRVRRDSRSVMNVVWRIRDDEALEKQFVSEAAAAGLVGLKGHRSVGGIRASIYNAVPLEGVQALVSFMDQFIQKHG
ncbi:3-phosphoserine/phosphohydroxythreonine transaminase [bacterium]|nr:3-phosphoserine/phosphohydroxythreonine transaminase [candidate division CSSED10-310 bacterium]